MSSLHHHSGSTVPVFSVQQGAVPTGTLQASACDGRLQYLYFRIGTTVQLTLENRTEYWSTVLLGARSTPHFPVQEN